MLAPDYLDHAPDRLVLLFQQVEDDILRDVARRISKMDTMTSTANWQLWRYEQTEALRQDVVKKLARYTGKSEAEIRRLMARGTNKLLEQLRTGSIELTIDAEGLSPGDVAFCTIPELGYKATVRVADVITQSQSDSTTRTVRLGTPVWRKLRR